MNIFGKKCLYRTLIIYNTFITNNVAITEMFTEYDYYPIELSIYIYRSTLLINYYHRLIVNLSIKQRFRLFSSS